MKTLNNLAHDQNQHDNIDEKKSLYHRGNFNYSHSRLFYHILLETLSMINHWRIWLKQAFNHKIAVTPPRKQIKKSGKKEHSGATHVVEGLKNQQCSTGTEVACSDCHSRVPLLICNIYLWNVVEGVYNKLNPYFYIALSRFPLPCWAL